MGDTRLLRATIPEAYGGSGLNYVCYGRTAREMERIDFGYRLMMSVQSSLLTVPIFDFGNEAKQLLMLSRSAEGSPGRCMHR